MGGICGKPSSAIEESEENPKQRQLSRKANELHEALAISSKRHENIGLRKRSQNGDDRIGPIDRKVSCSRKVRDDHYEGDREMKRSESVNNFPGIGRVTNSVKGEQISAGWPMWLVNAGGEAIKGWIPRKADSFLMLSKIGQGTYSIVFKGRDLTNNKIVALKNVRFDSRNPESVKFMAREILLLRRLDHPNIIKLEGLIASRRSSRLSLIFEYMEHDLTGLTSLPGDKFTEPQIKCYMKQLFSGLEHCHSHGVLHRDIKGSNLLINDDGILKIADFGLANYFDSSNRRGAKLTSRVVTLWYRPPELLLGVTQYGAAVDLWSAGCVLGELYSGKPIMAGKTEIAQVHMIFKLCGYPSDDFWRKMELNSSGFEKLRPYRRRIADVFKDVPDVAIRLMEVLLSIDPVCRGTAATALKHEFFTTEPVACDPSSFPKYLPNKETDAKLREEQAKRQRSSVVAAHQNDSIRLMHRRQSCRDHNEELASDLTESMKDRQPNPWERIYKSGPLVAGANWTLSGRKNPNLGNISKRSDSSIFSDLPSQVDNSHSRTRKTSESHGVSSGNRGQNQYGRVSMNDRTVVGGDRRDGQIQFSGPLLAPSSNIKQLLKEDDRRIQEVGRRLRKDNTRSSGRILPRDFSNT